MPVWGINAKRRRISITSHTWEKYTKEIIAGKEVGEQLRRAFVNSIRKLDYRAAWLDDSIPEIKALGEED